MGWIGGWLSRSKHIGLESSGRPGCRPRSDHRPTASVDDVASHAGTDERDRPWPVDRSSAHDTQRLANERAERALAARVFGVRSSVASSDATRRAAVRRERREPGGRMPRDACPPRRPEVRRLLRGRRRPHQAGRAPDRPRARRRPRPRRGRLGDGRHDGRAARPGGGDHRRPRPARAGRPPRDGRAPGGDAALDGPPRPRDARRSA